MRVSLFITCYNDTLFPATGRAVVRLMERLGIELDFHPAQTCCGQMHANTGFRMTRINGVHGPRFLSVIIVRDAPASAEIQSSTNEAVRHDPI